jgi:broad specificity phosphatase PhoE
VRRLYLMRHGETLYLGRDSPDGTDLTPEGRRQVEVVADLFTRVRLDLVVASPMRRAMGTAGIIAGRKNLGVEPATELREIAPGPLHGLEAAEVFSRVLEFFSSPDVTWDTPFVGGETFRGLRERVMRFVAQLIARPAWTGALAVAHGGVNMALLASVLGMGEGEIPRVEQDLACINVIDFDDAGRGLTRLVNFAAHDPVKEGQRERSFARLERVLEARGRELADVRSENIRGGPARPVPGTRDVPKDPLD